MKPCRGFTLIEITIVIVILSILAVIVTSSVSRQITYYALQKTSSDVISLLEKAHNRALNSYNDSKHSVRIESNRAILFEGTSYSSSNPLNTVLTFDNGVTAQTVSLNGEGNTVTFEKVTGATSNYGTIRFTTSAASSSSSTVTISEAGVIYSQ